MRFGRFGKALWLAIAVASVLLFLARDFLLHPRLLAAKLNGLIIWRTLAGPIKTWWGDLVRTVEVHENAAYVGLGTQMGVLDISDPRQPVLLRTFDLYGVVHGFIRHGSTLFCAHGSGGMSSFDVTHPLDPVHLERLALPGYGMHVALLEHDRLLLSNEMGGWDILDVSDPANMIPVAHFDGGWVSAARVYGNIAYVLDGWKGVTVYDMTNPERPVELANVPIQLPKDIYEPDPPPIWLEVQDGYAYVSNSSDGLRVIDVHEPAKAKAVGHLPLPGYSYTVAVRGNRAYMANLALGLAVIDISDPVHPLLMHSIATPGNAYDIILRATRGYLADGASGMMILDFTDPDHPAPMGYFHVPARTRGVTLDGERLVTADAGDGIRIFEVADRLKPRLLGSLDTPGLAARVAVRGERIYVADVLGGFVIVDAAAPTQPRVLRHFAGEEHPWDINADGDYLYAAMGHHGFSIFGLRTDPPAPVFNRYTTLGGGFGYTISIAKTGNLALSGDLIGGLTVYDVKDPAQATRLGDFPSGLNPTQFLRQGLASSVTAITSEGERAYLAGYSRGLEIVDLADPSKPKLAGRLKTRGHAYGVWKDADRLCVTTHEGYLSLVDVTEPSRPRLTREIPVPGELFDVVCEGEVAYVAAGSAGLAVVDLSSGRSDTYPVSRPRAGGN